MPFLELYVNCEKEHADLLEEILFALDAQSVSLLKTDGELLVADHTQRQPLPDQIRIQALFDAGKDAKQIEHQLNKQFKQTFHCQFKLINDNDWQKNFQQCFEPIIIEDKLGIYPAWETSQASTEQSVMINPGLAFGTGNHPTTYLCLQALLSLVIDNKEIIDFGCGSGILAISALKLGAKHAYALDIDADALVNCQQNAKINHINAQHLTLCDKPTQIQHKADILLANILANPLVELKPTLLSLCRPGAILILSGILKNQQELLLNPYKQHCKVSGILQRQEWMAVILEKY